MRFWVASLRTLLVRFGVTSCLTPSAFLGCLTPRTRSFGYRTPYSPCALLGCFTLRTLFLVTSLRSFLAHIWVAFLCTFSCYPLCTLLFGYLTSFFSCAFLGCLPLHSSFLVTSLCTLLVHFWVDFWVALLRTLLFGYVNLYSPCALFGLPYSAHSFFWLPHSVLSLHILRLVLGANSSDWCTGCLRLSRLLTTSCTMSTSGVIWQSSLPCWQCLWG